MKTITQYLPALALAFSVAGPSLAQEEKIHAIMHKGICRGFDAEARRPAYFGILEFPGATIAPNHPNMVRIAPEDTLIRQQRALKASYEQLTDAQRQGRFASYLRIQRPEVDKALAEIAADKAKKTPTAPFCPTSGPTI